MQPSTPAGRLTEVQDLQPRELVPAVEDERAGQAQLVEVAAGRGGRAGTRLGAAGGAVKGGKAPGHHHCPPKRVLL